MWYDNNCIVFKKWYCQTILTKDTRLISYNTGMMFKHIIGAGDAIGLFYKGLYVFSVVFTLVCHCRHMHKLNKIEWSQSKNHYVTCTARTLVCHHIHKSNSL